MKKIKLYVQVKKIFCKRKISMIFGISQFLEEKSQLFNKISPRIIKYSLKKKELKPKLKKCTLYFLII